MSMFDPEFQRTHRVGVVFLQEALVGLDSEVAVSDGHASALLPQPV